MKKIYIDNNAVWVKYQYEITNINGIDFISTKTGFPGEIYDPLSVETLSKRPRTWKDHLYSSPHIALARINLDSTEQILDFVNTWGLLGLLHTKRYSDLFWLSELFSSRSFNDEYPCADDLYKNKRKRSGERDREPLLVFKHAIRDYQQMVEGLIKFRNYSVSVDFKSKKQKEEVASRIDDIFDNYLDNKIKNMEGIVENKIDMNFLSDPNLRDEKGKEFPDDLIRKMQAVLEEQRQASVVYLFLNEMLKESSSQLFWSVHKSTETRGWTFKSLLAAIYLRVSFDLEEGRHFKHCEWQKCNRLFISFRPDIKTCSSRCRNSLNVYLHNTEKLLSIAVSEFPDTPAEVVEGLYHALIDQGYSGEKTLLRELHRKLDK